MQSFAHPPTRSWALRCASVVLLSLALLATWTPLGQARTEEPEPFVFVVIGDSRPNSPSQPQVGVYKRMLKDIDALSPAFVMHTGDAIYGSADLERVRRQYDEFQEVTRSRLRAKVYLTIGNHEIQRKKANQQLFERELGGLYYSFDHGGSHFILLNSEIVGQKDRITGEQLEWLKQDLRKARAARHKFVFIHSPLYPVDGHMGSCLDKHPRDRDALHQLFRRNRVDTVFTGHEHLFHERTKNGVRYIITGGGGAPLYPSFYGTGDFYHYVVVSVRGDKVEMKVVRPAQNGSPARVIPVGRTQR